MARPTKDEPLSVVEIDPSKPTEAATPKDGTSFYFGEIQVLNFADGTSFHVKQQRATVSDAKLIANLKEAAKNPSNKIFIE